MRAAQCWAEGSVDIQLFSSQYPEDRRAVPSWLTPTPDLEKSVLDVASFDHPRKLPLIGDVLERLYASAPDADYLIYTNVDIALMPMFYTAVAGLIDEGYDAFIVNRRTIPARPPSRIADIPVMCARLGAPHPGYDCFVFKRSVYPDYRLGKICIGAPGMGTAMALNLLSQAGRFTVFEDLHLTFHLGADRVWKSAAFRDYAEHNRGEMVRITEHFEATMGPVVEKYRAITRDRRSVGQRAVHSVRRTLARILRHGRVPMTE